MRYSQMLNVQQYEIARTTVNKVIFEEILLKSHLYFRYIPILLPFNVFLPDISFLLEFIPKNIPTLILLLIVFLLNLIWEELYRNIPWPWLEEQSLLITSPLVVLYNLIPAPDWLEL